MPDVFKKRYLSQMTYKDTNLYKPIYITEVFKRDKYGKQLFLVGCDDSQHLFYFLQRLNSNIKNTNKKKYKISSVYFNKIVNAGGIIMTKQKFNQRFKLERTTSNG